MSRRTHHLSIPVYTVIPSSCLKKPSYVQLDECTSSINDNTCSIIVLCEIIGKDTLILIDKALQFVHGVSEHLIFFFRWTHCFQ